MNNDEINAEIALQLRQFQPFATRTAGPTRGQFQVVQLGFQMGAGSKVNS